MLLDALVQYNWVSSASIICINTVQSAEIKFMEILLFVLWYFQSIEWIMQILRVLVFPGIINNDLSRSNNDLFMSQVVFWPTWQYGYRFERSQHAKRAQPGEIADLHAYRRVPAGDDDKIEPIPRIPKVRVFVQDEALGDALDGHLAGVYG